MESTVWDWTYDATRCKTRVWTGGSQEGPMWVGMHGFTGSGADFAPWFEQFSPNLYWEAPDLPGHGGFDDGGNPNVSSLACCRAMLQSRIEAVSRPVFLVGYSLGGRVALHFAAHFSHLIEGLVLFGANPGMRDEVQREARLRWEGELCERLRRDGVDEFLKYWQSLPIIETQKRIPASVWRLMQERRKQASAEGLARSISTMGTGVMVPLWDNLKEIHCPVLYCAGQEDEKYCRIGQEVVEQLPRGKFMRVPGAGHAAHLEAISISGNLVRNWYESL